MINELKSQLNADGILKLFDEYAIAYYISSYNGDQVWQKGPHFVLGHKRGDGSIHTFTGKDGIARATEFNAVLFNGYQAGNIFDWIGECEGITEFKDKLERAAEIIGHIPQQSSRPKIPQTHSDDPELKAALKLDFNEKFIVRYKQRLIDGLKSDQFREVCKKRGLDAEKAATLPNIGFATDWMNVYLDNSRRIDQGKPEKITIKPHSLVVWDDSHCTMKSLELDRETGKRTSQVQFPGGNCHWLPFDENAINNSDKLYLTEGEFDAIALIFAQKDCIRYALPCKPERENIDKIRGWATTKMIYLAYDNDKAGQEYTKLASELVPNAIDISGLWGEGGDPNDFVKNTDGAGERISSYIESFGKNQTGNSQDEQDQKNATLASLKTVGDVLDYLKTKNNTRQHSDCSIRFYDDELFGNFCYSLDPFGIRRFAPVACLVAFGVIRLAKYRKQAGARILTEQRIINLCGALKSGKDFVLGTTDGSHSIAYQLRKEQDCYSVSIDNAPPTGNGLARYALKFAADDKNKGLVKVIFHPESGNALTQGYDAAKRSGSLSSFDIGLSNRRVDVPKTGTSLKDFEGYQECYDFEGVCVRAFQNVNAQKLIIPRFAGGGESRREMWFAITHPVNDDMCNDKNAQLFEDVLCYSFDPNKCDDAFESLRKNALPFNPSPGDYYDSPQKDPSPGDYYDSPQKDTIGINTSCDAYITVYDKLLETIKNPYFRQGKSDLIRSQFQFMSALCAGLHGHYEADENDYWCAGYIVEVLSRSLDMISDWDNRPENTETLHAQILGYVERTGAAGVRADSVFRKFPDGKRAVSELLSGDDGEGAPMFRMIDANSKKGNAYYFASVFRDDVEKDNRFRVPIK